MKHSSIITVLFLIPIFLFAQENENSDLFNSRKTAFLNISPHLEFGIPLGNFKNRINKDVLFGKGVTILYRTELMPIDFGIRIGDLVYDNITRDIENSEKQKSKNKIWMWYGNFRYEPNVKMFFQPYFEGSFGINRFYSKTFTRETGANIANDEWFNPRYNKEQLNSDWALGYGGAVGFYLVFDKDYFASVDVQVGYHKRGIGEFLIKNDLSEIQENPIDNFEVQKSNMDLISFKIGISIMGFTE